MKVHWSLVGVMACALLLAGCGGGGEDKPTDKSGSLASGDFVTNWNAYCDLYRFKARSSGTATITLDGSGFDEVLVVAYDDSIGTIISERDSSSYAPETASISISKDSTYLALVTSYSGYETGSYKITFSKECGDVRQLSELPWSSNWIKNIKRPEKGLK
jgi:hypothetical protein